MTDIRYEGSRAYFRFDNTRILKEATVNELWDFLDEHVARLDSYCKESPINTNQARRAALSIKAIENELLKRGAL